MRYLATMPQEAAARKFGNYLLTLGIGHQLENSEKGWDLWIENEDDLERAQSELGLFKEDPDQAKYAQAGRQAEAIRTHHLKKQKRLRKQFVDVRTDWAIRTSPGGFPVTVVLILLAIVITLGVRMGENTFGPAINALRIAPLANPQVLSSQGEPIGLLNLQSAWPFIRHGEIGLLVELRWAGLSDVWHGQVWRLITPIFIHFSILHILFDLWWLYDLGSMVETRKGSWKLLGIVALSGVVGNLAQFFWSGPNFGGMSGVVYGLFGYIWIKSLLQPQEGMGMQPVIVWFMLGCMVACMTGFFGPIGNGAHLFGLISGVAMAGVPYGWRKLRRAARQSMEIK